MASQNIATIETREILKRKTKDEANKKIIDNGEEETENEVTNVSKKGTVGHRKNPREPIVKSLAEDKDIDLEKHFRNRIKYAERKELIEVDKTRGSKDKSSQKYVTISVQTGLFEALKSSAVRIMKEELSLNLADDKDPKVDTYGSMKTELKYHLYINYLHNNVKYQVKMDFINTTCTIGVDSVGMNNAEKIEGKTVAEYFVGEFSMKTVEMIKESTDLIDLNRKYKELARLGLQSLNQKKHFCFDCEKEVKEGNSLKCIFCKKIIHTSCGSKKLKKDAGELAKFASKEYTCNPCLRLPVPPKYLDGEKSPFLDQEKVFELEYAIKGKLAIHYEPDTAARDGHDEEILDIPDDSVDSISVEIVEEVVDDAVNKDNLTPNEDVVYNGAEEEEVDRDRSNKKLKEILEQEIRTSDSLRKEVERLSNNIELLTKVNEEELNKINKDKEELHKKLEEKKALLKQMEKDHKKEMDNIVSTHNEDEDINLTRLRLLLEEETKEKNKLILTHKKEVDLLLKAKIDAEDNLRTSIMENKKVVEEKTVLLSISSSLKELLDRKRKHFSENVKPKNDQSFGGARPREYICDLCDFNAKSTVELGNHGKDVHNKWSTLYPCTVCDLQAKSMTELRKHRTTHATKPAFDGDSCDSRAGTQQEVNNHKNNDHHVVIIFCEFCDAEFSSENKLNNHVENAHKKNAFKCKFCDYKCRSNNRLENHEAVAHVFEKFYCDNCDETFSYEEGLKKHMKSVHDPTKFNCRQCKKTFKTAQLLNTHVEDVHDNCFSCNNCNVKAKSLRELDKHIDEAHHYRNPKTLSSRKNFHSKSERKEKGPCISWNRGNCFYEDRCKYEHVEVCYFQEKCRFGQDCRYVHVKDYFLGQKIYETFQFRREDFPPLNRRTSWGGNGGRM